MLARNPASVQGLAFMLIFPLTVGGNVFVPTAQLPAWCRSG
jgi:oleandomycin transport system permease protein